MGLIRGLLCSGKSLPHVNHVIHSAFGRVESEGEWVYIKESLDSMIDLLSPSAIVLSL